MNYTNIIRKRLKPDSKGYMKYYIGKDLYELFDYAIIWKNTWDIEFFTQNPEYKEIWSKLRIYEDYGRCRLREFEYSEIYNCYIVDVFAPDLIEYLRSIHDYCNPMGEKLWKDKARNCGWNEEEVIIGYRIYKNNCSDWFERHYGKHIKGIDGFSKEFYEKQHH